MVLPQELLIYYFNTFIEQTTSRLKTRNYLNDLFFF
jgi:hypothetical protein